MFNLLISAPGRWDTPEQWTGHAPTIHADYGFFHVYAFTMTMGIVLAIALSAVKLWIRKIPVMELLIGAVIIVPISLFGGSFIGKINKGYDSFWSKFQFWEGGMAIHGGVWFGLISGLIVFHLIGRFRTKVSMWTYADCIVPNILIGQAFGRWGNFFNHEIHGLPISESSGSWMPAWLRDNLWFTYSDPTHSNTVVNGIQLNDGQTYLTEPVFLYESIGLFAAWLLITFVIPGFGRWISRKPWKLFPNAYEFDLKYSAKVFFTFGKAKEEGKLTYWETWDDFFYKTYDEEAVENYEKYYHENILNREKWSLKSHWQNGVALERANNPYRLNIVKSGVEAGTYFFLWNFVRYILELRRFPQDALINNNVPASQAIIISSLVLGATIIACCQWVFPYLFRIPNYRYEKDYFALSSTLVEEIKAKKNSKKLNK
jgi:phosphatidylglycerol:prolipoprotein diacylglycerol transferase